MSHTTPFTRRIDPNKLVHCSRSDLCPVCDGDHKCSYTPDGLHLCGRRKGEQPGFVWLGAAKDPQWHLYRTAWATHSSTWNGVERREEEPTAEVEAEGRSHAPGDDDTPSSPGACDRPLPARHTPTNATPPSLFDPPSAPPRPSPIAHEKSLLEHLQLPADFPFLLTGVSAHDFGGWKLPECDADGEVIGMMHRQADGAKRMCSGSHRGLTIPGGLFDSDGSVYVVEGASDTLAMAGIGLACVGRPSNTGGSELLIKLLANQPPDRPITVVGENDRHADGRWPGWEGAELVAKRLADALPNPVGYTFPRPPYKDVRDWISKLLPAGIFDTYKSLPHLRTTISGYLDMGVRRVEPAKKPKAAPKESGWPVALVAAQLVEQASRPTRWVWDGFLARGAVTLLSALPKCGKTTLLASLLAALAKGGSFAGRPLQTGRAVVISEEDPLQWAERTQQLGIGPNVRFLCRPFPGRLVLEQWEAYCRHAAEAYLDADLIVFDTLANLWPVRDENNAGEVSNALLPLLNLAKDRSVLLVHHLRKSDGSEGTAARGSGALAAGVDILLELRRSKGAPAGDRKRVLTAMGRPAGIPAEWVLERDENGGAYTGHPADEVATRAERVQRREKKADDREAELRAAVLAILTGKNAPMTRKEIWEALPEDLRVNENRFYGTLEDGVDDLWRKEGARGAGGGFTYSLLPHADS